MYRIDFLFVKRHQEERNEHSCQNYNLTTFNQRTLNSPSRAGTEITLLFAPTTSSRNYELLYWKRLQILILGHGCSRACSSSRSCTYIHAAEISEFLGQLFACINRRVTSHVMQSQIACLVLRFVTVVYHLACGFRVFD